MANATIAGQPETVRVPVAATAQRMEPAVAKAREKVTVAEGGTSIMVDVQIRAARLLLSQKSRSQHLDQVKICLSWHILTFIV